MPTSEREALLTELELMIVEAEAELACPKCGAEPQPVFPPERLRLVLAALRSYRDQLLVGSPWPDDPPGRCLPPGIR